VGGVASSSATAVAGSSPFQDKSVDFLQSTQVGCQPSTTTTFNVPLGKDQHLQTRLDHRDGWAPRILAMSTSPASVGASSCASVAVASSVAAAAGSVLPSATGGWRFNCAKSSSKVGAGLRLPPAGSLVVSQSSSSPCSTGSEGGICCKQGNFIDQHTTSRHKYSTILIQDGLPPGMWSP
jgi:hypothetical protein